MGSETHQAAGTRPTGASASGSSGAGFGAVPRERAFFFRLPAASSASRTAMKCRSTAVDRSRFTTWVHTLASADKFNAIRSWHVCPPHAGMHRAAVA